MIQVRHVSKSYLGRKVLDDVSLTIPEATFCVIVGPSGSGKTTLLQLISGLDKPTRGEILVDGNNPSLLRGPYLAHFRNREIGYLFQNFFLEEGISAFANVEIPGIISSDSVKDREQRVLLLLKTLGITDAQKPVKEFSGGQKQRIALARAMYHNPPILLADEPTGSLNQEDGDQIVDLLFQYVHHNRTVVMVTHNPDYAEKADLLIYIQDGKVMVDKRTGTTPAL